MTKYFKILILAMLVVGLVASGAIAGTITNNTNSKTYKMALELVRGGSAATAATQAKTDNLTAYAILDNTTYTPTDIPLGTLTDALFTLTLSDNATWDNVSIGLTTGSQPDNLTICDTNDNVIARYKTGIGTSVLQFDKAGTIGALGTGAVTNLIGYKLRVADNGTVASGRLGCVQLDNFTGGGSSQALGQRNIVIAVPRAATSVGLKWAVGIATTQTNYDCATATLIGTTNQVSASVTGQFNANLSASDGFKKFYENNASTTADNATIAVTAAPIVAGTLDKGVVFGTSDNVSVLVSFSALTASSIDNVTLDNSTVANTFAGTQANGVCTVDTTAKTADCRYYPGAQTAGTTNVFRLLAYASGNQTNSIAESAMTGTVTYNFGTASAMGQPKAEATVMLPAGTALGSWVNNGYVGVIPYLNTDSSYPVTCIVNNSNTSPSSATVSFTVMSTEGTITGFTSATSLGSITAQATGRVDFSGTNVSFNQGTATSISSMGASKKYSAKVTVGANQDGVTMTCIMTDPATGGKRLIPVLTDTTITNNVLIGPKYKF